MCGKFFCSAASTAACESPVFCETNAISFGTSAAAPALRGHDRVGHVDVLGDEVDAGPGAGEALRGERRLGRVQDLLPVVEARNQVEAEDDGHDEDADHEHDDPLQDSGPAPAFALHEEPPRALAADGPAGVVSGA